ncbi:hypothetical protein ACE7GA_16870 [Roseomonas sp. CCTCC AB2023176]|uniref:hypothetical protein n=1 Tax=Roseomonas sp. CCTCC AB2023176 TaxID=3342640 RepID=UPI0035D7D930
MTGKRDFDPGDAVPPGVAPAEPVPLTEHDKAVKRKLERLGGGKGEEPDDPAQGQAETEGPEQRGR